MKWISLLVPFLLLSTFVSAQADIALGFHPFKDQITVTTKLQGFEASIVIDEYEHYQVSSISLGPFRIGSTRLIFKNTSLTPIQSKSFFETRLEHTSFGVLSVFRADEHSGGIGFEKGPFKAVMVTLPILESNTIFRPQGQNQGFTALLRYKEGPLALNLIGSQYTPLALEVTATLSLGGVTLTSITDSTTFPYRFRIGLKGGNTTFLQELGLGREPLYSGSVQALRYKQSSSIVGFVGSSVVGFDYRLILQNAVRRELRFRVSLKRPSFRVYVGWEEKGGWFLDVKSKRSTFALSAGKLAYQFVSQLECGEVRLALTSKGVFSVTYTYRFTIDPES